MAIVYLANARMPTEKAHGLQMAKMCETMAALGRRVIMVVPFRFNAQGPPHDLFKYYGIPPVFTVARLWTPDLVPLDRRAGGSLYAAQSMVFGLVSSLYARRRSLAAELIYTRDRYVAWWLARLARVPFVYEANDLWPGTGRGRRAAGFIAACPRCRAVVLVNRGLARRYVEELGLPPEKVVAAPNGVDLEAFAGLPTREEARRRLGLPLDAPIIGYMGSFRAMGREKGIPELVRAAALLPVPAGEGPGPLLVCVGGPREAVAAYRAVAREAGLAEERLRFVDRVPHTEVPLWLRAFDVGVIPLPGGEHYARLSPLKLFEYMAAGVPVVAGDLPNIREVLRHGENAWLTAPGDPQALAEGLAAVLQDPTRAARLADRARQDAAAYTWKERARRILERAENA